MRQMVYQRTLETTWHVKTLIGNLQKETTEERIKR